MPQIVEVSLAYRLTVPVDCLPAITNRADISLTRRLRGAGKLLSNTR